MFTGIVQEIGEVEEVQPAENGARIVVRMPALAPEVAMGDSVNVNGTCLTAVELGPERIAFEAMGETLARTTTGALASGAPVNLEPALRPTDRMGGHVVQGHVDAVGTVAAIRADGIAMVITITAPPAITRYVVEKGSIAVNGVSLTVSQVVAEGFEIWLIPHTCEVTTFGSIKMGDGVNLEVDIYAKYVEKFAAERDHAAGN
ncbi:MAG: riboflavin synthase [Thermoleophilia bacterium]|nr:riboflavin synthase [Thermoleophilia bacterium]